MISEKKKVYTCLNCFCTNMSSYNLPYDVFNMIWKGKQQLESIDDEPERATSVADWTWNIPDVSFVPKGCCKHHKNGRKAQKIKRLCRFAFRCRMNQINIPCC